MLIFYKLNFNRSKNLLNLANVPSWVVITPEFQRRNAEPFIELILKTGSGVGFRMPRPEIGKHVKYVNFNYILMSL